MRIVLSVLALASGGPRGNAPEPAVAPTAADRLDAGVRLAESGEFTAALDEFLAVRDQARGDRERDAEWQCATFDVARALYERAVARPLPESPNAPGPRPEVAEVANARARLAAARGDLEGARNALLDLREAAPDDEEVAPALTLVALALRRVLALDTEWRERGTPRAEAARGQSAPSGPLKLGPSSNRAAAGAPGQRTGATEEGSGQDRVSDPEIGATLGGEGLTQEDARTLLEQLRQVHEDRRAYDQRRSDAAAARSGRRS